MAVVGGGVTCETIVVSDGLVWRESKEEAMTITGGCRCRAVRYSIEAEAITTRHCWCRDCQYIGAGSGTVNVFFPSIRSKSRARFGLYKPRGERKPNAP